MPMAIPLVLAGLEVSAGLAIGAGTLAGGLMIAGGTIAAAGALSDNKDMSMIGGLMGMGGGVANAFAGSAATAASADAMANTAASGSFPGEVTDTGYTPSTPDPSSAAPALQNAAGQEGMLPPGGAPALDPLEQANNAFNAPAPGAPPAPLADGVAPAGPSPTAPPVSPADAAKAPPPPDAPVAPSMTAPGAVAPAAPQAPAAPGQPPGAPTGSVPMDSSQQSLRTGGMDAPTDFYGQLKSKLSGAVDWSKANPELVKAGSGLLQGAMGAYGNQQLAQSNLDRTKNYQDWVRQRYSDSVRNLQIPSALTSNNSGLLAGARTTG